MVNKINAGKSGFYELFADKIIFAICVHCTECWLVAYYTNDATIIHDCDKKLQEIKLPNNIQFSKKQKSGCHEKLSADAFENRDKIEIVTQKSPSFDLFIQQLKKIPLKKIP